MRTLTQQLGNYAAYHRDRRNIATHFIGIPMIYVAVAILLSRPGIAIGAWSLGPILPVAVLVSLYYLALDLRYGLIMTATTALAVIGGHWLAAQPTATWLGWGLGLFVVGWIIQLIGHYYEGRKPAFVDDLTGLIIGPLFIAAEAGFAMGWRKEVASAVEEIAGPTRSGAIAGQPPSGGHPAA